MTASARPARRPSIAQRHPARAAAEAARQAEAEVTVEDRVGAVNERDGGGGAGGNQRCPAPRRGAPAGLGRVSYAGKTVTTYSPTAEDKDRAQAALAARSDMEGYTSAWEWMADVLLERTEAGEKDYNGGRPFTEVLARRRAAAAAD